MVKMLRVRAHNEVAYGCDSGCCRPYDTARGLKHRARQLEKHEVDTIVSSELSDDVLAEVEFFAEAHVYDGERCVFCGVNIHDDALYGPYLCDRAEGTFVYTTESE